MLAVCLGLAVCLQLLFAPAVLADDSDSRLTVILTVDGNQQGAPDVDQLLKTALPVLWNRVVPVVELRRANALGNGNRLVARIIPGPQTTLVQFNSERVFAALREAHIPAIITPPGFHLMINMNNAAGQDMQQTSQLLMAEAARVAPMDGIELSDQGDGLVLTWNWLDAQRVQLSVRGQSRLGEFSEIRTITGADPLPALQSWLDNILLRARDAYAYAAQASANAQVGPAGTPTQASEAFDITLVVQRAGSLLAQVALEDSLANDPRVKSLVPLTLSPNMQRYSLQLEGSDTSWMGEWFSRRGYRMDRQADGSLVIQ
jgi:hypothetical protein